MKKRLARVLITSFVLACLVLPTAPAAAIAEPDDYAINYAYAFDDLLEDGDIGFLMDYTLDYASNPTETAEEAFLFSVIDTDGVTALKTVAPYVFVDSGYGPGMVWVYFDAAEVTSLGITWGGAYITRVDGNPSLTWDGGDPPSRTTSVTWLTGDADTLMSNVIINHASAYELDWSVTLLQTTAAGTKLGTNGIAYFINVNPDLREMAPSLFAASEIEPETEVIEYGAEHSTNLLTNVIGTPFDFTSLAFGFKMRYNAGNATVTNGSTTVSGNGTSWTKSMVGRRFRGPDGVNYFVDDVNEDAQTLTLLTAYAGGTLANQTYNLIDTVAVSSILCILVIGVILALLSKAGARNFIAPIGLAGVVAGALLGVLAAQIAWGLGAVCAVATVLILLFKPSAS